MQVSIKEISKKTGFSQHMIRARIKKFGIIKKKKSKLSYIDSDDADFISFKSYKFPSVQINTDLFERVIEMYKVNVHKKEISEITGLSMFTVYKYINMFKAHGMLILESKSNFLVY